MDPDNPSRLQGLALLKTALSPNWQGDVDQLHAQLKQVCPQLNKIQELMGQADDFQANNDVASALKCLKKGLKIDPNYIPLHGQAAVMYRRLGQNEKALKQLHVCTAHLTSLGDQATKQYPTFYLATVHANLGRALGDTGKCYEEALESFRRATEIDPSYISGWLGQSDILFKMGRTMELARVRQITAERFPTSHMAAYNYAQSICAIGSSGDAFGKRSQMQLAVKWYLKAWRNDVHHTDPDYPAYAASVLNALGRLDEAHECIDAALAINPTHGCALRVQVSLTSQRKNAGNATTNDQNMQHMFRQSQRLLQAEREARDIQLGRAIDYVNEADEKKLYRGGDTAGNVMDRSERPTQRPSSMVDRLGALVVIDAGTRTGGYENRIGLVCKLCNEQRITLSLLKEKGNGKDLTQGLHSKRISKMREELCVQHKDITMKELSTSSGKEVTDTWVAKHSTVRVRHTLITPCCNHCYATKESGGVSKLLKCSRCKVATYCSATCQRAHWAEHKKVCKKLVANQKKEKDTFNEMLGVEKNTKGVSHSSWKTRSKAIRNRLKKIHLHCRCKVPWPLTYEVDAMLADNSCCPAPSYFTCHPNQRFQTALVNIVSKKTGNQRQVMMLRESQERACHDASNDDYNSIVPLHMPLSQEMFVLGEVIFTAQCKLSLTMHYRQYPGQWFQWPTGETIGICPGTGKKITPDKHTKHLMVTWSMFGSFVSGSTGHMMNRVFPRILTLEGYQKIVGGSLHDPHRCVQEIEVHTSKNGTVTRTPKNIPFYPDFVHQNEKNGQALSKRKGNPGASPFFYVPKKARSSKKGPVFASDAFQRYSEDLWEKDFERYVMVKSSSIMQRVSSPGLNVSVQ